MNLGAPAFLHTMTVDSVIPVSPTASKFFGHGFYQADSSYTWTVMGLVSGSDISFVIVYTGTQAGYTFTAEGEIAADGSMSGTATDSNLQYPLTWSLPSGSAHEVLSYTASVSCAIIPAGGTDATFGYTIPPGFGGLSGVNVVFKAHDGGTPGTDGDTWQQALGTCASPGAFAFYPIVGGNLVVHNP